MAGDGRSREGVHSGEAHRRAADLGSLLRALAAGSVEPFRGLDVPELAEDFTADPVELFFDLAFVFAFSQLVAHLIHHPTWTGAAEAWLLFAMLWMAWSTFTWSANAVSGNARSVLVIFLIATAATLPAAGGVTTAYEGEGMVFAISVSIILAMALATSSGL